MLLSLLLGAGTHAICMTLLTVLLSLVWGTANIAGLYLVTFPYFGFPNGYVTARYYAAFNGARWGRLAFICTLFFPAVLFSGYFLIDWLDEETSAKLVGREGLSFGTLAYLTLFINVPGTLVGVYQGFLSPKMEAPTKQSRIWRDIPDFSTKARKMRTLCASILPFIAIYLQFGQFTSSSYSSRGALG